jgi:hypothetical protein
VVLTLVAGIRRLARSKRLGVRLPELEPREVRRLLVGDDEVRYELTERDLFVLRLWHQREARDDDARALPVPTTAIRATSEA